MPVKKIAFLNFKGGVGKTTLSVNIASALSVLDNKKVLLVDVDSQASASIYMMGYKGKRDNWSKKLYPNPKNTLPGVIHSYIFEDKNEIRNTVLKNSNQKSNYIFPNFGSAMDFNNLHLVSSHYSLPVIAEKIAMDKTHASNEIIKNIFTEIENEYGYIIFDCPPALNVITENLINYCDNIIIPFIPDMLSTHGVLRLLKYVKDRAVAFKKDILVILL